ncbi:MAG: hypothetical protein ABSE35_17920 [Bryobacteraceae bacterium]|jgi:hypothetical protein
MPGKPPAPSDHVRKADENKSFGYGMIATHPTSAGWALTAMFYSALHYAEAYFLKTSKHVDNHGERSDAIKFDRNLSGIYGQYMHLFDCGFNARYRLKIYGKSDVEKAKPSLEAVEKHIKSLL